MKKRSTIDFVFWFLEALILFFALKLLFNYDLEWEQYLNVNTIPFLAIVFAAGIAYQKIQQNKKEIKQLRDNKIPELEKQIREMYEQTRREIQEVRDLVNQIIGKLNSGHKRKKGITLLLRCFCKLLIDRIVGKFITKISDFLIYIGIT